MNEPWKDTLEIDELVHSPIRLSLLLFLLPRDEVKYREIQWALGLTAGNLTSHLKRLQKADLVEIRKVFVDERPMTVVSITQRGRTAVREYSDKLYHALGKVLESGDV